MIQSDELHHVSRGLKPTIRITPINHYKSPFSIASCMFAIDFHIFQGGSSTTKQDLSLHLVDQALQKAEQDLAQWAGLQNALSFWLQGPAKGEWEPWRWKSWENPGKTMGKSWETPGKTMGKPRENHGKTMGKTWENISLVVSKMMMRSNVVNPMIHHYHILSPLVIINWLVVWNMNLLFSISCMECHPKSIDELHHFSEG